MRQKGDVLWNAVVRGAADILFLWVWLGSESGQIGMPRRSNDFAAMTMK